MKTLAETLKSLNDKQLRELAEHAYALDEHYKYNKIETYFPSQGTYKRSLYPKHVAFMAAGSKYHQRAFVAANRVGKSLTGMYELVCHLTGIYPDWWEGVRFNHPIDAWVCSESSSLYRETMQETLFGSFADQGTGMIPKHLLIDTTAMQGIANCVGYCTVRHISGGVSKFEAKSYEQGWKKFQGAKRHFILLDEEPDDPKIVSECITRTAGNEGDEGHLVFTFTPLSGISKVVQGFLPNGLIPEGGSPPGEPDKFVMACTWDDVPHLSEAWKRTALAAYDPSEREARSKGIPSLGSGRIYPFYESDVVVHPFKIPEDWPRAYAIDFGYIDPTAVIWLAENPQTKELYVYAEYKKNKSSPYIHVESIKARGSWIRGAADPSGGGSSLSDGKHLIDEYRALGLDLTKSKNDINSGIARIQNLFECQRLKIFATCQGVINEARVYRYGEPLGPEANKPARGQEDHFMDCLKYGTAIFDYIKLSEWDALDYSAEEAAGYKGSRDNITGY